VDQNKISELRELIASTQADIAATAETAPSEQDPSDEYARARRSALGRLVARSRSCEELRRDLRSGGYSEEVVEQVVTDFVRIGLLDDLAFARAWIAGRQESKALSSSRLRHELVERGVDSEAIGEALSETDCSEFDLAVELARRGLKVMTGLDRETVIRRLSGRLARRGHSPSIVRSAVLEVMGEVEASGDANIADDE
jgi:regulatory protein